MRAHVLFLSILPNDQMLVCFLVSLVPSHIRCEHECFFLSRMQSGRIVADATKYSSDIPKSHYDIYVS
jgi:hypothetical protein